MENRKIVMDFFTEVFNEILRTEEKSIVQSEYNDLSITEIHVIEAVSRCADEAKNMASQVAKFLRVVPGTLTASVGQLCRKGYLVRERDENDRRVVRLSLTERGRAAYLVHEAFHERMLETILAPFDAIERDIFCQGLQQLAAFFKFEDIPCSENQD